MNSHRGCVLPIALLAWQGCFFHLDLLLKDHFSQRLDQNFLAFHLGALKAIAAGDGC